MANSSDIIKIGFDYRSSLAQFEKETNGVFDGISEKAGKQKIVIQLDAKNDKVIEKIKELQKLKLDKFTFEFGDSGIKEQLKTFGQLENKINEIINLSKGLGNIVSKTDFGTKNKTEAYNQLKQMADVFKNFYGNEEAMHTKAGTEAAHAYYKAYEEALKKGVAQSKIEKIASPFEEGNYVASDIKQFENFQKYGGEATDLSIEISKLEERLINFSSAYSIVKANLGEAPITPEIIKNIEEYVRYLELAKNRSQDTDLFSKEDIDATKDMASMYLGFATEDAIEENKKYLASLKEVKEEKEKVDETISKSSPTSSIDGSKFEELKSDITEVRQELDSVKEKIFGIDSEGFESIKSDVERTTESVKELNSELTELKSKVSGTSTGNKSNISSGTQIEDVLQGEDKTTTDASTTAIKEESKALEQVSNSAKEASESKEKFAKANKEVKSSADSSKTSISEEEKYFNSLGNAIKSYDSTLTAISRKPVDGNRSKDLQDKIDIISASIKELRTLESNANKDGYIFNKEDVERGQKLEQTIKDNIEAVKKMSAAQKGSTPLARGKTIEWANDLLKQNTKWSKAAKIEVQAWMDKLATADPSNVEEIRNEILKIVRLEREAGREGQSWLEIFNTKKLHSFLGQAASMFSFYDLVNLGREGFQTIRELDTALTEMRKVSDESVESLKRYQAATFDVGDAVGATAKTIQNSTADWMRLGESIDEAAESAKTANILLNVSEFDSIDSATESLVSMSQAYKELEKIDIIDVLNNIGNNYSISTDGLATALQKSASALKTANNDLNEAVALTTAGNAIAQDPDSVGAGLRTISLRLVGTEAAKEELKSLGEETDDVITTTSKLRDTILSATKAATNDGKGFDIFDSNGNYKSTYEIMQGLADLYDEIVAKDKELGTNNLNLLLETIAGKNRSNIAASILQNGDMLRSVYEDAQNSAGSAQKELDAYLESIDGRMTQLENRAQEFWYKVIDSDTIKNGITLLTDLLELGTNIVDTFGVLPTIMTGIGAGLAVKNIGRPKMFGLYKYADINMCSLGY